MDLAGIFRQALELWQSPTDTELPEETFINCANRCLTQRGLDLDLTPDACFFTVMTGVFQFADSAARDFDLNSIKQDISRITRVESRSEGSASEDDWVEEVMTSFDNWNDTMERGDGNFCCVYGTTPNLTLRVNRDVSGLEFRVVYRQLQARITATSTVLDIPDIYEAVLVYDIALEMGELIDNLSSEFLKKKAAKMPYLEARLKDTIERIDKWRRSQKGTSITRRRAFNDRQPSFEGDRKRFTINFFG